MILFLPDETPFAGRVLEAGEVAGAAEDPGATFVRQLVAAVFVEGAEAAPAFGVVAPTGGGTLVLLRGAVAANILGPRGSRRLSGLRAMTWVDEIARDPVRQIGLCADGAAMSEVPHTDLRAGIAPGGGVVVRDLAHGTGAHYAINTEDVAAQDVWYLVAQDPISAGPTTPHHPQIHTSSLASAPPSRHRIVDTASYSSPTGVLTGVDGASYPLDRAYVIGRDPLSSKAVREAAASPIAVSDRQLSRVHAFVTVDGGTVLVQDNDTRNGTFIAAPGAEKWTRLGALPQELPPGWSLRVGHTVLTYRSAG
ncbi:FHA domain-containing protein [Nocardia terpenica]|uniref:FHA domain-containing protein n=1 Tax=Nocardia terpenica TaxID=455432 RepID=A0A6G9YYX9_9NOCA|nr:FHA domain-containing protein [Nocardia terpenica]QIS18380.1 FHA domain-containing protein [Nocardia terpenica]